MHDARNSTSDSNEGPRPRYYADENLIEQWRRAAKQVTCSVDSFLVKPLSPKERERLMQLQAYRTYIGTNKGGLWFVKWSESETLRTRSCGVSALLGAVQLRSGP